MSEVDENLLVEVQPKDLVMGQFYWVQVGDKKKKYKYRRPYFTSDGMQAYDFRSENGYQTPTFFADNKFYKLDETKVPPGAGAEGGRKSRKQKLKKRRRVTRKKTSVFSK